MSKKRSWLDGRMPFFIGYVPSDLDKNIVKTHSGKKLDHYEVANQDVLIADTQISPALYYMGGGVLILGLLLALIGKSSFLNKIIPFLIISLILYFGGYFTPKKKIIFDRKNGLITIPDWFFFISHTIPFGDAKVFWTSSGGASGALGQRLVARAPKTSVPRSIDLGMHPGLFTIAGPLLSGICTKTDRCLQGVLLMSIVIKILNGAKPKVSHTHSTKAVYPLQSSPRSTGRAQ